MTWSREWLLATLTLRCEEASMLTSCELEERLSLANRLALRSHSLVCQVVPHASSPDSVSPHGNAPEAREARSSKPGPGPALAGSTPAAHTPSALKVGRRTQHRRY